VSARDPHTIPGYERAELEAMGRAADAPIGLEAGRILAASLVEGPCRAEVRNTCTCSNQQIVFYTGEAKRREHALCLGMSSRARILAHWEGYTAPSIAFALHRGEDAAAPDSGRPGGLPADVDAQLGTRPLPDGGAL
jgi:hypothetical protein